MPSTYHLPRTLLRRLQRESHKADIHELCYLLFGRGARISKMIKIPNRADDTVLKHVIMSRDVERVRSLASVRHLSQLGYLHTHPVSQARPSQADVKGYAPGTLIFIYADCFRDLRAFRIRIDGRRFVEKMIELH